MTPGADSERREMGSPSDQGEQPTQHAQERSLSYLERKPSPFLPFPSMPEAGEIPGCLMGGGRTLLISAFGVGGI